MSSRPRSQPEPRARSEPGPWSLAIRPRPAEPPLQAPSVTREPSHGSPQQHTASLCASHVKPPRLPGGRLHPLGVVALRSLHTSEVAPPTPYFRDLPKPVTQVPGPACATICPGSPSHGPAPCHILLCGDRWPRRSWARGGSRGHRGVCSWWTRTARRFSVSDLTRTELSKHC